MRVGQRVLYRLGAGDVADIDRNRPQRGPDGRTMRNAVQEGQVLPAQVVAVFSETCANLIVTLDGYGTHWATSRQPGPDVYQWEPLEP